MSQKIKILEVSADLLDILNRDKMQLKYDINSDILKEDSEFNELLNKLLTTQIRKTIRKKVQKVIREELGDNFKTKAEKYVPLPEVKWEDYLVKMLNEKYEEEL